MTKSMMTKEEVTQLILAKKRLFLAGSEAVLSKLPAGDWIAGTIPYFMSESGGIITNELIQTTVLPPEIEEVRVKFYNAQELPHFIQNNYTNGFNFIIIPAFSKAHQIFAEDCSSWQGIFNQPLVGWISGMDLNSKNEKPKVFNGKTGANSGEDAVIMHIKLKEGYSAQANIINIFKQGSGDTITFQKSGFNTQNCFVNGKEKNFSQYITENKIDLKLPLVADYKGAMINVSIKEVKSSDKSVDFYAPVFPGVEYRFASAINNYELEFENALKAHPAKPLFACNCILNFLYANLNGKKAGNIVSAMTFGEVAYMLLNQTMVYISLEKLK